MSAGPFSSSSALWEKSVRKLRLPRLMNTARGTRARLTAAAAAALAALCAGILAPAQPAAAATLVPLNLLIPASQAAGDYTSGLDITAVSTNP